MDSVLASLTPAPGLIKTTMYLWPEVAATIDAMPYHTRTAAVNGVFLALGRQQRQLPGVGPRPLREFADFLGIEDTLPPEYQLTAREREQLRIQRDNLVGLPKSAFDIDVQAEHIDIDVQAEHIDIDVQAEHIDIDVQPLKTVCQKQSTQFPVFAKITNTAMHPAELEARGARVLALVQALAVLRPESLERLRKTTTPETPTTALEAELETLVALYAPAPLPAGKRRLWRDLS